MEASTRVVNFVEKGKLVDEMKKLIYELKEPPCKKLEHCPYGPMVESFPLDENVKSCPVFGHDCPAFSMSERMPADWSARVKEKWP